MNRLENEILPLLEAGQAVALATIVSLSGSAPRTPGTRMAVLQDGGILGTIGGGRLEAEVIQTGLESLGLDRGRLQRFALTGKDASDMDMICGGVLDVLVEPLRPVPATINLLRTLRRLREAGEELHLITLLREETEGGAGLLTEHLLARRSASGFEFLPQHPDTAGELRSLLEAARSERCPTLFPLGGIRAVIEPILGKETVHLFGAGHVSKEVAALAHYVDFRVEVSDDRAEFANAERFPRAEAIHVPEDMAQALNPNRISENSYVVILTRGHKHDMDILAQALRTNAAYIGMIGSRRKRDTIYTALRRQGFTDTDLYGVHCPVGLDIDAETPAEIALSIVGELVKIRAANRTTPSSFPTSPQGGDHAAPNPAHRTNDSHAHTVGTPDPSGPNDHKSKH